jgi:hypothetical protein
MSALVVAPLLVNQNNLSVAAAQAVVDTPDNNDNTPVCCCCEDQCKFHLGPGYCERKHQCLDCKGYIHTICGHPIEEFENFRYSNICFSCYDYHSMTAATQLKRRPCS